MKKIFTLITAMFIATCLNAQVNVVDAEGNVCENGGTLDFYDEYPEIPVIILFGSPKLVNTSNSEVSVQMDVNIRQLPENTSLSDCFSGVCTSITEVGTHKTATKTIAAKGSLETQIEWDCRDMITNNSVEGICIVDFTLYVNGQKAQTFTARYINGEVNTVKDINANTSKKQGTFTLDGKRIQENAKGLLIRNGKKVVRF